MDALQILHQMHLDAEAAFTQIHQAAPDQRGGLWAKLRPELVAHEQIEERFVYDPIAKDAGHETVLQGWAQRHHQQVQQAEHIISEIGRTEPREPAWLTQVAALHSTLERHIAEEEGEIWPAIRHVWDAQKLESVGRHVQAAKTTASAGATVSGAIGAAGEALKSAADKLTHH